MKSLLVMLSLIVSLQAFGAANFEAPSFGSLGAPKKIFGIYLRNQVTDASEFPFRVVGQLEVGCTATLIGPKHIVTAGHCVWDDKKREWINDLDFFPARTSSTAMPFGRIGWKKVFVQKEYLESGETKYDFAVIELEKAIGDEIGWSGYKVLPAEEYSNNIRITGYPGDKAEGTMWTVTCPSSVTDTSITYKCDTYGGMSGSGVYSLNPNPDQTYITSIHTWGNTQINGGVVLDNNNFQLVKSWKNDSTYSANTVIHENENEEPKQDFDKFYFKNNCHLPIRVYLHWKDLDGDWKSDGPWRIEPGNRAYVADTRNRIYYFAGLTTKGETAWKGDVPIKMDDGNTFYMIKGEITTDDFGEWTQILSCK